MCTALIDQLMSDGHINAEEAVKLTSNKLFEVPTSKSETTMLPSIAIYATQTVTSSNGSVLLYGNAKTCITTNHNNVVNVAKCSEDDPPLPLQSSYFNYESETKVNLFNASEENPALVVEDDGQVADPTVATDNTIQPSVTSPNIKDTNVKETIIQTGTVISKHMDISLVKNESDNAQTQSIVVAKTASNQEIGSIKGLS